MAPETLHTVSNLLFGVSAFFLSAWASSYFGLGIMPIALLGGAAAIGSVYSFAQSRKYAHKARELDKQLAYLEGQEMLEQIRTPERQPEQGHTAPDAPHRETYWQDQLQEERQTLSPNSPLLH